MATESSDDDHHIVSEVLANPIASRIDQRKLETKIRDRSTVDEMQMRGILYDHPSMSPGLIDAHRVLEKRRASVKVEHMLKSRPSPDELRRKNILMQKTQTQATKSEHKRKLSRRLSEKLLARPAMEELADIIFDAGLKAHPEWKEDEMTVDISIREHGLNVEYGRIERDESEEVQELREQIEELRGQIRELEEINLEQRDHMLELRERSHTHTTMSNATTPDERFGHGRRGSGDAGMMMGDRDSLSLDELQRKNDELTEENFYLQQRLEKALERVEREHSENEKHFEKIQEMTQTITKLMTTRMSFQQQDAPADDRQRKASLAELMNRSQLTEIAQAQIRSSNGSVERISELDNLEGMQAIAELEKKSNELQTKYIASQDKVRELRSELQSLRQNGTGGGDLGKIIDLIWERSEILDENDMKPVGFQPQLTKILIVLKKVFDLVSSQKMQILELKRDKVWQQETAEREKKRHAHKASMDDASTPFSYQNVDAALAALESPEKMKILELEKEIKLLRKSKQQLINSTSVEMERMRARLNALTFQLQGVV